MIGNIMCLCVFGGYIYESVSLYLTTTEHDSVEVEWVWATPGSIQGFLCTQGSILVGLRGMRWVLGIESASAMSKASARLEIILFKPRTHVSLSRCPFCPTVLTRK